METLPSGLPEQVGDEENLARFLTQSNHFNALMVKPAAFLPNPKNGQTSVFRQGNEPHEAVWQFGQEHVAGERNIHGVAVVKANHVREVKLDVLAKEPPPRHANIVGWPTVPSDPELEKARRKDLANQIAQHAELLRRQGCLMDFRIADTFTDSLVRLTGEEQKAVKTTAFDLQMNPANPGMSFHKLDKAKDKNFWSVRVSRELRLIVHKTDASLLLCYVDHHDKAYHWAERRKLETHPKTGAAQLVEIRETVQEVVVPVYVQEELPAPPKPALFANTPEDDLLGYGVPPEWLEDVRRCDEDSLLVLTDRLPAEAAEALLELATGGQPRPAQPAAPAKNPFEHPDAQRRFRVVTNIEELQRALDFPWEKWTVFLHPEQREFVERDRWSIFSATTP